MPSLRDKTISGVFWSFLQNVGSRGIGILTTIVLARILTPKDFGLIGMLTVFIAVSQTLINGGFNQALIQKKDTDEDDYSSVFWINLTVSILLYGILFLSAPLISDFYRQPILKVMLRVLSLVFVINAFSYVQQSRLTKELRFKTLMFIHIPSTIFSAIVAIIMALTGFGVWSLIAQQIVMRLAYTVQIWIYSKWTPLFSFNRTKAKDLFSFGGRLMISAVLNKLYENIYLIIIGRLFSVSLLGYYQNARSLTKTPAQTLASVVKSVTFPAFSSIQEDDKRLKIGYKKAMQQLIFWVCPALVLAGVLAVPLFRLVLTDKWLPAVPFFRLLCIIGILLPLNSFNLDIINVKGRSDLYLKLNIIKKILVSIGIVATIPFGIWVLVGFQAFFSIVRYGINSYYSGRFINYPLQEQLLDLLPILLLSAVVGGMIFVSNQYLINKWPDVLKLIIGFGGGGILYWLIAKTMRVDAYLDFTLIVTSKAGKFKKKPKLQDRGS